MWDQPTGELKGETIEDTTNKESTEVKKTWNESLEEILNSPDAPADKFYS